MEKLRITAYSSKFNKRTLMFTWIKDAESGIKMAQGIAEDLGIAEEFTDYRAEPIIEEGKAA